MNSNKTLIVFMLLIGAYLAMVPLKMMPNTIHIKGIPKSKLHSIDQMNLSDLEDVFEDSKSFFSILDQDGDGKISAKELNHVLLLLGEKIPMSSVKAMIEVLDDDSNGSISLKEFLSLKPEEQTFLREGIEDMIISQIHYRKGDATEEEKKFVYCVLEKRNGELIKKSMIHDMENSKASKGFSLEDTKASKGFSLEDTKASKGFSPEEMKEAMAYTPRKGKHYKCNYQEEMKYAGMSPEEFKYKGMFAEDGKQPGMGRPEVKDEMKDEVEEHKYMSKMMKTILPDDYTGFETKDEEMKDEEKKEEEKKEPSGRYCAKKKQLGNKFKLMKNASGSKKQLGNKFKLMKNASGSKKQLPRVQVINVKKVTTKKNPSGKKKQLGHIGLARKNRVEEVAQRQAPTY